MSPASTLIITLFGPFRLALEEFRTLGDCMLNPGRATSSLRRTLPYTPVFNTSWYIQEVVNKDHRTISQSSFFLLGDVKGGFMRPFIVWGFLVLLVSVHYRTRPLTTYPSHHSSTHLPTYHESQLSRHRRDHRRVYISFTGGWAEKVVKTIDPHASVTAGWNSGLETLAGKLALETLWNQARPKL